MTHEALIDRIDTCMADFRKKRLRYQFDTKDWLPDQFPDHLTRKAEAAAIVVIVREHDPAVNGLVVVVAEAREFIDGQIDVVDGPYGEPTPNRAMQLAQRLDEAMTLVDAALGSPALSGGEEGTAT